MIKYYFPKQLSLLLAISSTLFVNVASAQSLYRYIDSDGITILNSSIPSEYVNAGYEVLNSTGQVLEVVPPFVPKVESTEEIEAKALAKTMAKKVEKEDSILLSSYSDVSEIERRRDRRVESLGREIQSIEVDRRLMVKQLEKAQQARAPLAAKLETVAEPSELQLAQLSKQDTRIERIEKMANKLADQLASRKQDVEETNQEYALKIERFVQLKQAKLDTRQTALEPSEAP